MRKIGQALALVACVSMTVVPVAPSFAATPAPKSAASAQQKLVDHAARGEAIILSKAQLDRLATTNKALHAKILKAHQTGTVPNLTAAEKKMMRTMTAGNLDEFKAGHVGAVWIVVAVVVVVLLLFTPLFCPIFGFMPSCGRYGAPAGAVTARY
jgi:hypothetical protein